MAITPQVMHMPGLRFLFALILWALTLTLATAPAPAAAAAAAADLIVEKAWLEDPTGKLLLQDVRQQPMQRFEGVLSRGYGTSAIWIRVRIDPTKAPLDLREPDRLVLRMRPVYLDEIIVHDDLSPGGFPGVTGDRYHPRSDEYQNHDFTLAIPRGKAPRDLWLRLQSTSTRQIDIQALTASELDKVTHRQELVFSIYLGLIIVFSLWGLVHWLWQREAVVGAYALMQGMAAAYALSSLGFMRALWPPEWPAAWLDTAGSVTSVLAVAFSIFFHTQFLREIGLLPWVRRAHLMMLGLQPAKLLVLPWNTMLVLQVNLVEVLIAPLVFLISTALAQGWQPGGSKPAPPISRRMIMGFYLLLSALLMFAALPGLGAVMGSEVSLYVVQTHGLVVALLIMLILMHRSAAIAHQQKDLALALERTELKALQEQEVRQEQDKLLAMLTHELKTPLATMQMRLDPAARGAREIRSAIRDMNSVIERCRQATELQHRRIEPNWDWVDIGSLLRDAAAAVAHPERMKLQMHSQLQGRTDRQLLFIVLSNLLENACKYSPPDSAVEVLAERLGDSGGAIRITVSNQPGTAGWPDPALLFGKYYRSPQARRQAGTGLGLFLAANLMTSLAGRLSYQPDATRVSFVLELPREIPATTAI